MTTQRSLFIPVAAIVVAALLFLLMQVMIQPDDTLFRTKQDHAYLNFVRVKPADDQARTKDRRLPEPPPDTPPPPQTPDVNVAQDSAPSSAPSLSMNMPALNLPLNNTGGPFLGSPGTGGGVAGFDADVIPVVQVAPVYPRAAKQAKLEGYVTMRITIRPDGTVVQATVIDAKPKRLFDDAAKQAILRWKFRPKVVDGQAVAQEATQTIEFTLSQ